MSRRRKTSYTIRCWQMFGTAAAVAMGLCAIEGFGLCLKWLAGAR